MRILDSTTVLASFAVISWVGPAFGFSRPSNINALSSTTLKMATWSDSKAVKEYQEFLSSGRQELDSKSDCPSVIIKPISGGSSELSDAFFRMGMGDDLVLTPDQNLPESLGGSTEYPIYVTLPPTQIESFIQNLSDNYKDRNEDFVFFSGGLNYGNIEDVLKEYGYCRDSMTQVLITGLEIGPMNMVKDVSVKLGVDAMGMDKWAGECSSCGKWNGAVAKRMERSNVRCNIDFYREWRRRMWERSALDAVFHLVGAVRQERTSLAEVALYYDEEVSDMLWEISGLLRGWKALTLTYGFEERLFGVAENTGGDKPCTLLDDMYPFIWSNRVFTEGKTFNEYLWYAREERGLLQSVEFPPKRSNKDASSSIMRQGNFRADGVI
jgi:hypothetical protein